MKTLVIHTPKPSDRSGNRSFEDTIATCTGEEFAIFRSLHSELEIGMPLIILDKRQRKQAEATISAVEFQNLASNGTRRYNVLFRHPRPVPYNGDEIPLNRCGVALVDRPLPGALLWKCAHDLAASGGCAGSSTTVGRRADAARALNEA